MSPRYSNCYKAVITVLDGATLHARCPNNHAQSVTYIRYITDRGQLRRLRLYYEQEGQPV